MANYVVCGQSVIGAVVIVVHRAHHPTLVARAEHEAIARAPELAPATMTA